MMKHYFATIVCVSEKHFKEFCTFKFSFIDVEMFVNAKGELQPITNGTEGATAVPPNCHRRVIYYYKHGYLEGARGHLPPGLFFI